MESAVLRFLGYIVELASLGSFLALIAVVADTLGRA
jgi:hypothetical protein